MASSNLQYLQNLLEYAKQRKKSCEFSNMDFLGSKINFNLENNSRVKTNSGSCLSIIFQLLLCVFFYIQTMIYLTDNTMIHSIKKDVGSTLKKTDLIANSYPMLNFYQYLDSSKNPTLNGRYQTSTEISCNFDVFLYKFTKSTNEFSLSDTILNNNKISITSSCENYIPTKLKKNFTTTQTNLYSNSWCPDTSKQEILGNHETCTDCEYYQLYLQRAADKTASDTTSNNTCLQKIYGFLFIKKKLIR